MRRETPLPMVRCRLDNSLDSSNLRYVPAAEFDLWRTFMMTQHNRAVVVDEVSVWVPDTPKVWNTDIDVDRLEPVLRLRFEKPTSESPHTLVPVVRFMPIETYPIAKEALLAHFDPECHRNVEKTPGYFVTTHTVALAGPDRALSASRSHFLRQKVQAPNRGWILSARNLLSALRWLPRVPLSLSGRFQGSALRCSARQLMRL
jgi:hypothetical protein